MYLKRTIFKLQALPSYTNQPLAEKTTRQQPYFRIPLSHVLKILLEMFSLSVTSLWPLLWYIGNNYIKKLDCPIAV